MRVLLAAPLLGLLAACGADGTFKSPAEMTAEERCFNLELGYRIAEANGASAEFLARARTNINLVCPSMPPAIAAEAQAEAAETVAP